MTSPRLLAVALASAATLGACTDSEPSGPPEIRSSLARNRAPDATPADLATLVDGDTAFAADLLRAIRAEKGNLFFSPHSIATALRMTYAGARGETRAQMAATLHVGLPDAALDAAANKLDLELASRAAAAKGDKPFKLHIANSIWVPRDYHFEAPFLDTLAVHYDAGVRVVDFVGDPEGSRAQINDWVEGATEDKIKDLLPDGSIRPSTRLVLTNAIYFNASWATPFPAATTAPRPFQTAGGAVDVPSLRQTAPGSYGAGPGFRAAELPYDGGKVSMVVVVPDLVEGDAGDPLQTLEAGLTGAKLRAIVASLKGAELTITLPKFRYEAPLGLKDVLQGLGMTDAFSGAADFSGINGQRDLLIQDVLHKGMVGIDEKGTEAAAATAVIIGKTSAPEPQTLTVDRPFLFFIIDRPTGSILFLGRVVDPR